MHSCTYGSSIEHSSRRQFVPFPPRSRFHLLEIASQYFYSLYTGKKHTHTGSVRIYLFMANISHYPNTQKKSAKKRNGKKMKRHRNVNRSDARCYCYIGEMYVCECVFCDKCCVFRAILTCCSLTPLNYDNGCIILNIKNFVIYLLQHNPVCAHWRLYLCECHCCRSIFSVFAKI